MPDCALGQGAAPGGGGGSGRALAPGVLDCVFVRTQRTHGHTPTGTGQNEGVPPVLSPIARLDYISHATEPNRLL